MVAGEAGELPPGGGRGQKARPVPVPGRVEDEHHPGGQGQHAVIAPSVIVSTIYLFILDRTTAKYFPSGNFVKIRNL